MQTLRTDVGRWYEDRQSGAQFEVVAIDRDAETIEVQLLDGALCEYDFDSWHALTLRRIEEPEDWRNAFELDDQDRLDPDRPYHPDTGHSPLDDIEPDVSYGLDDE